MQNDGELPNKAIEIQIKEENGTLLDIHYAKKQEQWRKLP
jgi:hypothetical protein